MARLRIVGLILLVLSSCSDNRSNTKFLDNFNIVDSVNYDSTFFRNLFVTKDDDLRKLSDELRTITGLPEINEKHGDLYKYEAYFLDKIDSDNHLELTYYLRLNSDIPFDAYIQRVLLVSVNSTSGALIGYNEIGLKEQHFGTSVFKFAKWSQGQVIIQQKKTSENLNTGEKTVEETECSIKIDKKGKQKKTCR